MPNLLLMIVLYARGAWRFRWTSVLVAWGLAILGAVVVWTVPNTYQARARVYVDTDTVLRPLLTGLAVNTDVMTQVSMISTVLLSRPNLERVARESDLLLSASSPAEQEDVIDSLRRRITLEGARDNVYSLAYTDTDRERAHAVVQKLVNTFIEGTLGNKRADSGNAQRFLQEQIREYEARLRAAEDRLADFKQQNVGLMPGEQGDYYTRLQSNMTALDNLRDQIRIAQQRRDELAKQLEGEEPTFGLVLPRQSAPPTAVDAKLAEYRQRREQLLLNFTEKHPDVVALTEQIAALEAQAKNGDTGGAAPAPAMDAQRMALSTLDINPVYQNMKIALSKTDVELAELRGKHAQASTEVARLRAMVDRIPEIEAQLARLNRDYEVNKVQHTALLQRLESARLSEQAEQSNEDVKFRVIEPPLVPIKPVAPGRSALLAVALVFSLGAAAALAVVLHHLKPIFATRAMLAQATGLPVIGSVSFCRPAGVPAQRDHQPLLVGGAVALLVFVYMVGIALVGRVDLAPVS